MLRPTLWWHDPHPMRQRRNTPARHPDRSEGSCSSQLQHPHATAPPPPHARSQQTPLCPLCLGSAPFGVVNPKQKKNRAGLMTGPVSSLLPGLLPGRRSSGAWLAGYPRGVAVVVGATGLATTIIHPHHLLSCRQRYQFPSNPVNAAVRNSERSDAVPSVRNPVVPTAARPCASTNSTSRRDPKRILGALCVSARRPLVW